MFDQARIRLIEKVRKAREQTFLGVHALPAPRTGRLLRRAGVAAVLTLEIVEFVAANLLAGVQQRRRGVRGQRDIAEA